MRTSCTAVLLTGALGLLLACSGSTATASGQDQSGPRVPVVVELFTSEGCSSCPPADRFLTELVETQPIGGVEIIALGEHVDYWDRLGWKDPFSSAAFSMRQSEYAHAFHVNRIYTPQLVIDGTLEAVGSDTGGVRSSVMQAARAPKGGGEITTGSATDGQLSVTVRMTGLPPGSGPADLYLAIAQHGLVTKVEAGENGGRTLAHTSVARTLVAVAAVSSGRQTLETTTTIEVQPEWDVDQLTLVAFVQERGSRRIVAAAAQSLASARVTTVASGTGL